jgi:hypothetical protein
VNGGLEGLEIPLGQLQLTLPQDGLAGLLSGGRAHEGRQAQALNRRSLDEQLLRSLLSLRSRRSEATAMGPTAKH